MIDIFYFKLRLHHQNISFLHCPLQESIEKWRNSYYHNPERQLNKSKPFCNLTKPRCGKGVELIHGFYEEEKWLNSLGWFCQKCKEGEDCFS